MDNIEALIKLGLFETINIQRPKDFPEIILNCFSGIAHNCISIYGSSDAYDISVIYRR